MLFHESDEPLAPVKIHARRVDLDLCTQRGRARGEFFVRRRDDYRTEFWDNAHAFQRVQRRGELSVDDQSLYLALGGSFNKQKERCLLQCLLLSKRASVKVPRRRRGAGDLVPGPEKSRG